MLNTCTTPDPVTLIASMGHLLGLLVRICLLHTTENPAFYTSLLSFNFSTRTIMAFCLISHHQTNCYS